MQTPFGWTVTPRGLLAATILVGLQVAMAWGTFHDPFLDTRHHYFYDNALFTTAARNANRIGFPANRLGVVIALPHDRWNEPSGPPAFYTHHPYLMKLLMRQFMAVCGYEEWTSRAFSLGVSIVAAVGMLTTVAMLTGSVACGLIAATVFIGLPAMAIYQTCVKPEIDGMAASAWLFPAILLYVRRPATGRGILLAGVGGACGLSAWTSLLFAVLGCGTLLLPSAIHRRLSLTDPQTRAALWLGGGLLAAGTLLLAAFTWQKGGVVAFANDLAAAFRVHADRTIFSPEQWIVRQRIYLWSNYGALGLALLAAAIAAVTFRAAARSRSSASETAAGHAGLLDGFALVSLATPLIWVATFREGSYVHEFWSIGLCMPIAAALPLVIGSLPASRRRAAIVMAGAVAALVYVSGWQSFTARLAHFRAPEATVDIAFVKSLREESCGEFIYIPLNDHPANAWFHPRLFEYYTDRTLRFYRHGDVLRPDQKVILLRFTDQEAAEAFIEKQTGSKLVRRVCGPRCCAYDVIPAATRGTP
jgi:hypothetical protein